MLVVCGQRRFNQVFIYSTEERNYTMSKTPNEGAKGGDDSVTVRTSDGQQGYIDVTVLYRINADKANIVHLKWQNRYEEDFVRAPARPYIRDAISGYVVDDLLTAKPV